MLESSTHTKNTNFLYELDEGHVGPEFVGQPSSWNPTPISVVAFGSPKAPGDQQSMGALDELGPFIARVLKPREQEDGEDEDGGSELIA